jgi:hypothetical protein
MPLKPRQMKAYPAPRADIDIVYKLRNTVNVKICVVYVFILGKNELCILILKSQIHNFLGLFYSMANLQTS